MTELTREQKQAILDDAPEGAEFHATKESVCDFVYYANIDGKMNYYSPRLCCFKRSKDGDDWHNMCLEPLSDLRAELERKTVRDAVSCFYSKGRLLLGDGWYINQVNAISFNGAQVCTIKELNQCAKDMSFHAGEEAFSDYLIEAVERNIKAKRDDEVVNTVNLMKATWPNPLYDTVEIEGKCGYYVGRDEFNQCVNDLSVNGNPELFEMYQKADKTLLESEWDKSLRHELKKLVNIVELAGSQIPTYLDQNYKVCSEEFARYMLPAQNGLVYQIRETVNAAGDIYSTDSFPKLDLPAEWVNGDVCVWLKNKAQFTFIGLHAKNKDIAVVWNGGNDYRHCNLCDLSKPESPEQKAGRELEEKAIKLRDLFIKLSPYAFQMVPWDDVADEVKNTFIDLIKEGVKLPE